MTTEYKSRAEVKKEYPGCIVAVVCGGFAVFYSAEDYQTWKNQK
jgi:hypothetical protein